MSNTYFKFKQFIIHQDRCAMKVGTDGVLIGALAQIDKASNILEIGTGTGVVSLMMAQRNANAQITGIEIDEETAKQAIENIAISPWKERIKVLIADFNHYSFTDKYDCVVSNPPFFTENITSPNDKRNVARHTDALTFEALLRGVACILTPNGKFSVIIPTNAVSYFLDTAYIYGLYLSSRITIYSKQGKISKRTVLILENNKKDISDKILTIHLDNGSYTDEYKNLLNDFYL